MVNINEKKKKVYATGTSPAGGAGGQCSPIFVFAPPDFFSCPLHGIFFGKKKLLILGGKNVKICDFGQKKPSDFGEDLFFWRSPAFGRKICDFGWKKPFLFFGITCNFGQKNSAKTFAP